MKTRVMELNASDERGIAVVRDKVKHFAMGAVGSGGGGPPFKLIILDEADSLTHDAQAALRRTMETWSRVTRFCIICNYVSRIIDPLSSRCSKYRFSPLGEDAMRARLRHICAAERVDAGEDALTELLRLSAGDMRKAITYLQSAAQLYGGTVTPANVVEMSGVVSDKAMAPLLAAAMGGEEGAGGFDGVRKAVQGLLAAGYATGGILDKFADAVVAHPTLPNAVKAAALERIAGADKRLADGADEELQLVDAAATLLRGVQKLVVAADRERMYM
jgi:replication factor C subunit 2/4